QTTTPKRLVTLAGVGRGFAEVGRRKQEQHRALWANAAERKAAVGRSAAGKKAAEEQLHLSARYVGMAGLVRGFCVTVVVCVQKAHRSASGKRHAARYRDVGAGLGTQPEVLGVRSGRGQGGLDVHREVGAAPRFEGVVAQIEGRLEFGVGDQQRIEQRVVGVDVAADGERRVIDGLFVLSVERRRQSKAVSEQRPLEAGAGAQLRKANNRRVGVALRVQNGEQVEVEAQATLGAAFQKRGLLERDFQPVEEQRAVRRLERAQVEARWKVNEARLCVDRQVTQSVEKIAALPTECQVSRQL